MSERYIRRLRAVRDELDIAREVFAYTRLNWHRQEVADHLRPRTRDQIRNVESNLGVTYFVRLTAEFEGVLKDHVRTNHPEVPFPAQRSSWKVNWFLNKVIQKENIRLDPGSRKRHGDVRDYRNAIAHGNAAIVPIAFDTMLGRYTAFLAKLPEPFD